MADDGESDNNQRSHDLTLSPPPPPSPSSSTSSSLDASSFTYTPFYCEENVYFLCKKLSASGIADPVGLDLFVVFISNEEKKIPLWYQKASKTIDGLVLWDYHVICTQVKRNQGNGLVLAWDLDTSLPLPSPLKQYINEAIRPLSFGNSIYRRLFRVVHAPILLRYFASDRSHMKDPLGNWVSLPPTYEPIVAEDGTTNNLQEYIQMRSAEITSLGDLVHGVCSNKYGVLLSEEMLEIFFSQVNQKNVMPSELTTN
ncbi:protein N-terminal glutamine amidohydrolase isoform X1 [Typha latifolia]|uniref:protein N-terminal glutamine amidohydrolase isoform X1 n=1 Tax=Typha latifolia TaxID=4733 RepID=UPI003C2D31F1